MAKDQETAVAVIDKKGAAQLPPPVYNDETGLMNVVKQGPGQLKLVAATTRNPGRANPGEFLDSKSGEVFKEFEMVVFRMNTSRVFFPPGPLDLDAEPLCRSQDGIKPEEGVAAKQASSCGNCPQAKWNGKQKAPCQQKGNLMGLLTGDGQPYYFSYGGTSITSIKDSLQSLVSDIRNHLKNTGESLQLYNFALTVTSEAKSGKTGKYYTAKVKSHRLLEGEERTRYEGIFKEAKAKFEERQAEQVVDAELVQVTSAGQQVIEGEIVTESV